MTKNRNKENALAYQRAWRRKNVEKVRAYSRANYIKHRSEKLRVAKIWRSNNLEKHRASINQWYQDNVDYARFRGAKRSSRERGIVFTIKPSDISIPKHCEVLGIPLAPGKGKRTDNSPSLDRVDPKKGYVKGNVRIISWKANRLKSNETDPKVFRAIARYITRCRRKRP